MRCMTTQSEPPSSAADVGSKSDRGRALLHLGVAPGQIARQVGCSRNLVYAIRSAAARTGEPTARPAPQPTPPAGIDADIQAILAAVRRSEEQNAALREGLLRIRAIADGLLG